MQKQQGRKALIILSDGVDNASRVTLERAIESAQRANALVYSILFKDDLAYSHQGGFGGPGMGRHGGWGGGGYPGGRYPQQAGHPDGKKVLERISKETGGRFFETTKKEPIGAIYDQIEQELRNQYSLGFTPDKADEIGTYHAIHVMTRQNDLMVQARDGYYAEK